MEFIAGMVVGCILAFFFALIMSSLESTTTWNSEESFHDGSVVVHYKTTDDSDMNDKITIRFFAPGLYVISFENTDDLTDMDLPAGLTVAITDSQVRVIEKWNIPLNINVTIIKDGQSETKKL